MKRWGLFILFLLMCGIEGNLLPFTPSKWDMFRDNFGLDARDAVVNPNGVQNAWVRFRASHDFSHDGVNVAVEWTRSNAQRATKFLCAIILDLLILFLLVWIF